MTQEDSDHLATVVSTAVAEVMKKNGNGNGRTPKTWTEFAWMASMSWGPLGLLLVFGIYVGCKTIPNITDSTIEMQKSLITNLDKQSEYMKKQTEVADEMNEGIQEIVATEKETAIFMPQALNDHKVSNELQLQALEDHQKLCADIQAVKEAVGKP